MDEHWTPIMESCSVCAENMRYDFIIKYENLAMEERYLVRRLGVENLIKPRWENKQSPDNATTSQVSQRYRMRKKDTGLKSTMYFISHLADVNIDKIERQKYCSGERSVLQHVD